MSVQSTQALIHLAETQRFAPPRWLTATEVQLPDHDGLRFMDLVAMDLTGPHPEMHGLEVKVSRSDWLHELKRPAKSAPACATVDRHWLLAGSRKVFRDEEVPAEWGILVAEDGKLIEHRPAGLLVPRAHPATPWGRDITTAFMRRVLAQGDRQTAIVGTAQRQAEQKGYRKGMNAAKRQSAVRPGPTRVKYDPGRYNLDDGIPLDLP